MTTGARKWAVVTGASGGLGLELAREAAARGHDVVLTARSEAPMTKLADELRRQWGGAVAVEPVDLAEPDGAGQLLARLDARGIEPDVLINNAGFGLSEPFVEHDPCRLAAMLQLNVVSLTQLSWSLGRRMVARGRGNMLFVASLAAYQPSPMLAAYAASKAYILSLGEALNVELAPKVGVTVLSPGLMNTGFNDVSGFRTPAAMRRFVRSPAEVARVGFDALAASRPSVVAGLGNKALAFSTRLMSRHMAAKASFDMSQQGA